MVMLGGGNYLKASEVESGDRVKFLTEGEWVENSRYTYEDGSPKMDFVVSVDYKGDELKMRLSKTNRDIMSTAYGPETLEWIGKSAKIEKEKCMVGGKKVDMLILTPDTVVQLDEGVAQPEETFTGTTEEDKIPF